MKVKGMHCKSCEMLIADALEEAGATNISADHKTGTVTFKGITDTKAKNIIKKEGYEV